MTDATESTHLEREEPLISRAPDDGDGIVGELGLGDVERDVMWRHAARRLFGEDTVAAEPVTIGRYQIERRIGAGGMGVVYHAKDPELGRSVALKLLHPKYVGREELRVSERRMWREAQAMARLNHPNVVQIHEVGTHDEQLFLAMEYVDGLTLGQWIEHHRPARRDVLSLFIQAGEGLARAHAVGLVHRDFKPDNVLVGEGPVAKVTDFGLASGRELDIEAAVSASDLADGSLTKTGALLGTPYYMAPEQYEAQTVDARADQFSFCVALWEALCGQRPFVGHGLVALQANIRAGRLAEPPQGQLPGWIRRVLERGLQVEPASRYPSLDDLLAALRSDPTRRRWYLAGALLGVIAAGIVYAEQQLERRRSLADCATQGRQIDEVWSEDRRAAVREAIVGTEDAYAVQTVDSIVERFDGWAEGWSAARERACVEHEVDKTRDDSSYAKAIDCLDERRLAFGAQVEVLSKTRDSVLVNAVKTVSILRRQIPCLDEQALVLKPEVEQNSRRERSDIYAAFAQIQASLQDQDYEFGLEQARRARALAESSGIDVLIASAWRQEGSVLEARSQTEEAVEANIRAFELAGQSGAIEVAISAATSLSWETGVVLERLSEGHAWARIAALLVARSGLGDSWMASERLSIEAELYKGEGQFERAFELESEALVIREAIGDEWGIARSCVMLGGISLELGRLDRTAAMFERAYAIRQRLLGPEHPKTIQTISTMGVTYLAAGRYSEARDQMQRAIGQLERVWGADDVELIVPLINLGAAQLRAGEPDDAIQTWSRTKELIERHLGPRHSYMSHVVNNLASIYFERGDSERAVPLYEQALEITEQLHGPEHPSVNLMRTNLGDALIDRDPARARMLLEQAFGHLEASLGLDAERTIYAVMVLGKLAQRQGDPQRSQQHYQQSVDYWEAQRIENGGVGRPELGDSLRGVAIALRDQGRLDEARILLERAIEVFEGGSPPDPGRIAAARALLDTWASSE